MAEITTQLKSVIIVGRYYNAFRGFRQSTLRDHMNVEHTGIRIFSLLNSTEKKEAEKKQ